MKKKNPKENEKRKKIKNKENEKIEEMVKEKGIAKVKNFCHTKSIPVSLL